MDKIDTQYLLKLSKGKEHTTVGNYGCGPNALRVAKFANAQNIIFYNFDKREYPGTSIGDMEWISVPDSEFDGVMCINALDHTKDAQKALEELIRVAKDWVYINCNLVQKTTSGKGHYWDMLEDGTMTNGEDSFNLKDYGFTLHLIQYGGERRYDQVIARLVK